MNNKQNLSNLTTTKSNSSLKIPNKNVNRSKSNLTANDGKIHNNNCAKKSNLPTAYKLSKHKSKVNVSLLLQNQAQILLWREMVVCQT